MNSDFISIIISIVLGIPTFIALLKLNQTKIVYLEKQTLNLKDDLLNNFEDLSIKYKGIEVQNNIYFINGFIICQGQKDISNESNKIEISAPDGSKWLDFKIVSKSKGIDISYRMEKNIIELNFNLFKSNEFIEYESILEIAKEYEIIEKNKIINFHHRIPNIPSIKKISFESIKSGLNILAMSVALLIMPMQTALDFNKIDRYEIEAYNSKTNEKIDAGIVFIDSNFTKIEQEIIEKESGFGLLFKSKTKDFPIKIFDRFSGAENTKINSIYFKLEGFSLFDLFFHTLALFIFLIAILLLIRGIVLIYYQKKYLKLINK